MNSVNVCILYILYFVLPLIRKLSTLLFSKYNMNSNTMAIPVGIDLGSLNVRIALIDQDVPKIVNNADGDRFTLSLCKILQEEKQQQVLIGESCRKWCDRQKVSRESVSIRTHCDLSCRSVTRNDTNEEDNYNDISESATLAAAEFFKNMRQLVCDATNIDTSLSSSGGYTLFPAVSVPDDDDDDDSGNNELLIEGIRKAVSKGFCIAPVAPKVAKGQKMQKKRLPSYTKFSLISNAAAVCVAHGLTGTTPLCSSTGGVPENWKKVLVVDWGFSGLRVSVLSRPSPLHSMIEVEKRRTETICSGDSIVQVVMKHCASVFYTKHRLDVTESKKAMAKLRSACEDAIRTLCRAGTAHIMIDGLYEGVDLNMPISRPRFEMLISSLISKARETMKQMSSDEGFEIVLRSGNMCSLPQVSSLIDSLYPKAWTGNKQIAPEEAIAIGASINAASLLKNQLQTDKRSDYRPTADLCVSPIALGVRVDDGEYDIIIDRDTPLPAVVCKEINVKKDIYVIQDIGEGKYLEIARIKSSQNESELTDFRLKLELDGQMKVSMNGGKDVVIKV